MYYKCNEYDLIPYEYSKIEKDFFYEIKKLIDTFPLKIYDFFEKIHKSEIAYVRDSTMIISLFKLNKNEITNIFEILKRLLRIKAVSKIFYKKEFIIIHFYNNTISKILAERKAWMYIDYYFVIKEKLSSHVYYRAILRNQNEEKRIELFFYYRKKYYIFSEENILFDKKKNNIMLCTIKNKNKLCKNKEVKCVDYFLANTLKEEQIYKLVFTE